MYNQRRGSRGAQAVRRADPAGRIWVKPALVLLAAASLLAARAAIPISGLLSPGEVGDAAAGAAEPNPPSRSVPTPPLRVPVAAPAEPAASPTPTLVPASPPAASPAPSATGGSTPTSSPTRTASPAAAWPVPSPSPAPADEDCRVGDSFAELVRALGNEVLGRCLENEYVNLTTGDTHQRTTRGLLVWVKARGIPAFTDGATTWYRCGETIERRASDQPFPC